MVRGINVATETVMRPNSAQSTANSVPGSQFSPFHYPAGKIRKFLSDSRVAQTPDFQRSHRTAINPNSISSPAGTNQSTIEQLSAERTTLALGAPEIKPPQPGIVTDAARLRIFLGLCEKAGIV